VRSVDSKRRARRDKQGGKKMKGERSSRYVRRCSRGGVGSEGGGGSPRGAEALRSKRKRFDLAEVNSCGLRTCAASVVERKSKVMWRTTSLHFSLRVALFFQAALDTQPRRKTLRYCRKMSFYAGFYWPDESRAISLIHVMLFE
jgi:hypothetical protein